MPVELQRTFCRICEAHCGLVAEVERKSQRVLRLIPDREHPVSRAHCCAKGLRLGEVHHDPDRLDFPRKRGLRERRTHNSWLHNLERPDLAGGNRALMNPADARARGIAEGALINRAIPSGGPHLEPPSGPAIVLCHGVEVGLAEGTDATR